TSPLYNKDTVCEIMKINTLTLLLVVVAITVRCGSSTRNTTEKYTGFDIEILECLQACARDTTDCAIACIIRQQTLNCKQQCHSDNMLCLSTCLEEP
ncbi:hypothetical protein LSAT2_009650, partial [Lamellibrachia satsuma]